MAEQWFVGKGSNRSGPFSSVQLRQMASAGSLAPNDLVWREGMTDWQAAASLPALFASAASVSNPYAAPAPTRPVAALTPTTASYSFAEAFGAGTRAFGSQWGPLMLASLVFLGVNILIAVPQWILQAVGLASGDPGVSLGANVISSCLGIVLNVLIGGPMFAGTIVAAANVTAGRPLISDCFLGFKRYGAVILATLLMWAILIGVSIVAYVPAIVGIVVGAVVNGGNPGIGVAGAAFMVGGLLITVAALVAAFAMVGMRVIFTAALVADPTLGNLSVTEALSRNWSTVSIPRGFSLVGLGLVVSLLAGFSVLLLCVGYILVGLPFCLAVGGAAYALLFRGPPAGYPADSRPNG